ncbi:MAG: SRPBCC family protein [Chitinophagaceae bacterium]
MRRTIRLKTYFPYKRYLLWKSITDSGLLGKWFMENDLVAELNHEFTFHKDPQPGWDGMTYCKVTEIEPFQKITYTYSGKAGGEKTLACAGIHSDRADKAVKGIFTQLNTVLSFTLITDCRGSCLILEHSGFKGFKQVIVSFVFGMGWKRQMRKLRVLLDKLNTEET